MFSQRRPERHSDAELQAEEEGSPADGHQLLADALTRPEVRTHQLANMKGKKTHVCMLCNRTFYRSGNHSFKESHSVNRSQPLNAEGSFHSMLREQSKLDDLETPRHNPAAHSMEQRPFGCAYQQCGKSFSSSKNLKMHELIHAGEKRFRCAFPLCHKSFVQLGNLKTHERIHTGEKPYWCMHCDQHFTQLCHRQSHRCVGVVGPPAYRRVRDVGGPLPSTWTEDEISGPPSCPCSKPRGYKKLEEEKSTRRSPAEEPLNCKPQSETPVSDCGSDDGSDDDALKESGIKIERPHEAEVRWDEDEGAYATQLEMGVTHRTALSPRRSHQSVHFPKQRTQREKEVLDPSHAGQSVHFPKQRTQREKEVLDSSHAGFRGKTSPQGETTDKGGSGSGVPPSCPPGGTPSLARKWGDAPWSIPGTWVQRKKKDS